MQPLTVERSRKIKKRYRNKEHVCKQTVKTKNCISLAYTYGCQIRRHLRFIAYCSFLTHLCGSKRQAVTSSLSDATDKAQLHAVSSPHTHSMQWLAERTSAIRLRSATWRPRHPHRCWPSTGSQQATYSMWASSVPSRSVRLRKRTARPVVQRGQRSLCSANRTLC